MKEFAKLAKNRLIELFKNRVALTSAAIVAGVAIASVCMVVLTGGIARTEHAPAAKQAPAAEKRVAPREPEPVVVQADPQGDPANPVYTFVQRGRAHGVGLCMDGVLYRAQDGQGYLDIINYYYTNVQLTPTDDSRPIRVRGNDGRVRVLSMKDYLLHLAEEPETYPAEGLKVLAVASRTYALSTIARQRHGAQGFDICSSGNCCQAFSETKDVSRFPNWNSAVESTGGQALFFDGKVITAAYAGSCGGHTENNEDVWTTQAPIPYLRAKEDSYCSRSPRFSTTLALRKSDLQMRLNASTATRTGNLDWLDLSDRTAGGRVRTVKVIGSEGTKVVSGTDFAQMLGFGTPKFDVVTVKVQASNR